MPVNSPKRPPYCNSTSVSISTNHRSLRYFIQIGPPLAEKKFKMADFSGPVMGSLKRPCTTCYRSSIATIARNCLLFEKIALFCILATDRQTDKQMDSTDALSRSRCRERQLNKPVPEAVGVLSDGLYHVFALTVDEHFERHVGRMRGVVNFSDDVVDGAVDSRSATFALARLKT